MKKALIFILILVAVILLFPIRGQMKDGGTVEYRAILYTVRDMHQIYISYDPETGEIIEDGYTVGTVIEILGVEVFNNTRVELIDGNN